MPVQDEDDAARIRLTQDRSERRIEEGLKRPAQRALDEARIDERRQRALRNEPHRGPTFRHAPLRRDPAPRGPVARRQPPRRRDGMLSPTCLGDDLRADQKRDLDPDAREADTGAARLGAGGDVVIARQLAPAHAGAVVHDGERRRDRVSRDGDRRRARIERVGDDLGEDRRLGRPGICVAQVLEKVQEIDPRLAHRRGPG